MKTYTRITVDELRRFNNTVAGDICLNDNYNISKGYCLYSMFVFLNSIKKSVFGMFSDGKKLTKKILEEKYQIEVI